MDAQRPLPRPRALGEGADRRGRAGVPRLARGSERRREQGAGHGPQGEGRQRGRKGGVQGHGAAPGVAHPGRVPALLREPELDEVAALTPGFSGADLANLVNEAAILATRRNGDLVTLDDFTRAIERIVAGLEKKNRLLNPHEREVVAFHETGHALVRLALPGVETVHKISIIPRGIGALGYNIQRPTEDRYLMTEGELLNKMAVLMGGRAAELLVFGKLSTGAVDDLGQATNIARTMVTRYGMDKGLGQVTYDTERQMFMPQTEGYLPAIRNYSEKTAGQIDEAVRELIKKSFNKATRVLEKNRHLLDETAAALLLKEVLTSEEFPAVDPFEEEDEGNLVAPDTEAK